MSALVQGVGWGDLCVRCCDLCKHKEEKLRTKEQLRLLRLLPFYLPMTSCIYRAEERLAVL